MTIKFRRREFIATLGAGLLATPAILRAAGEPVVIRAGALKLIHSIAPYFYDQFVAAGYKVEVLPAETLQPMSAPSPAPAFRCRQASASSWNIPIRRRWVRSTWCSARMPT